MPPESSLQSNITTRISLRWPPEPPFENTDTLVLAIGEWYVDLRVDKKSCEIDWAFAGQCLLKGENPRQTLFTHEIDSHNNFNISDLGVFVPLPNGDELETGSMPRPDIPGNPVSDYEEVWRDLPIHEGPEGRGCGLSWILESENASLGEGQHRVQKVFLARIGGKYLALYQGQVRQRCQTPQGETVKITGDSVSARREEWVGDHWEEKYAWGRNSCDLPSMAKGFDEKLPASWYPGAKVDVGGRRYVVRAFEKTGLYGNNRRQPTTMSRSIPRRTAGI